MSPLAESILHESTAKLSGIDWSSEVGSAVKVFIENTQEKGEENDEYVAIKDENGDFRVKLVKAGMPQAHEKVFGHANSGRQYGFAYVPRYNVVTIDEAQPKDEVEEIVAECEHRFKKRPIAVWNGWFNGGSWLQTTEPAKEVSLKDPIVEILDAIREQLLKDDIKTSTVGLRKQVKDLWALDDILYGFAARFKEDERSQTVLKEKWVSGAASLLGMTRDKMVTTFRDALHRKASEERA